MLPDGISLVKCAAQALARLIYSCMASGGHFNSWAERIAVFHTACTVLKDMAEQYPRVMVLLLMRSAAY